MMRNRSYSREHGIFSAQLVFQIMQFIFYSTGGFKAMKYLSEAWAVDGPTMKVCDDLGI